MGGHSNHWTACLGVPIETSPDDELERRFTDRESALILKRAVAMDHSGTVPAGVAAGLRLPTFCVQDLPQ